MSQANRGSISVLLMALADRFRLPTPQLASGAAIRDLRARDPQAWEQFFRAEMPAVARYIQSRLGSMEEAEELSADVFAEAWEHIDRLVDEGLPPRAWLFGIARNIVAMRRRTLFRRLPLLSLDGIEPASHPLPVELLDLAEAIQHLSRQQAEIITLRFVHGLSLAETAGTLNLTVDAVKGRQARALAELKRRLSPAS